MNDHEYVSGHIDEIQRLTSENIRLKEALYICHASLCTYGGHPIIDKQVHGALDGYKKIKKKTKTK